MSDGNTPIIGAAGEELVKSHLSSLGIEAGIVGGRHADIVAYIEDVGRWVTLQVKASRTDRCFSGGGYWVRDGLSERKRFSEYKVDGFAFCFLPDPFPYYIAAVAIGDSLSFPRYAFTRSSRDTSFNEMVRRLRSTTPFVASIVGNIAQSKLI